MTKPFKGVINIDVRDSVPDWEPYEQPKAPDGCAERDLHRVGRHRLRRAGSRSAARSRCPT